ncbi:MAG: hypothetical protein WCT24_03425 [Patescibacteria group bacterium]|jgi:hypothetical protein
MNEYASRIEELKNEEKLIVPEMILNDLKYISVRSLYWDWFFPSGAEIATQLINNAIKIFLKSIKRYDLIKIIRGWGGNETHNIIRMVDYLNSELALGLLLSEHDREILDNLFKLYKARYIETMDRGGAKTIMSDIHIIDAIYSFFREKTKANLSDRAKNELFIEKGLSSRKDMTWGNDKNSLSLILYRENKSFSP